MEERMRLVTEFVVARTLKEFATKVGVAEDFADVLAQIHAKTSPLFHNWIGFLESNCAGCEHRPESCLFFHPTEESCQNLATPANTRKANVHTVESGIMKKCPVFSRRRQ